MAHLTANPARQLDWRALRAWASRLLPRVGRALLCLALAGMAAAPLRAQEAASLERRVKAAFVYKFVDYVTWPDGVFARPDTPLVFGVVGDEQVAADLALTIAGRAAAERPLAVRRLRDGDPVTGIHILFVAGREPARLAQAMRIAGTQPVLIVSEADGALDRGSAINFVLAGDRVKFEIALDAAEKRGLKLSSRLLTVALNVRPGSGSP
jgi:hypothetical protein